MNWWGGALSIIFFLFPPSLVRKMMAATKVSMVMQLVKVAVVCAIVAIGGYFLVKRFPNIVPERLRPQTSVAQPSDGSSSTQTNPPQTEDSSTMPAVEQKMTPEELEKNHQLAADTLKSVAEAKQKALNETLSMVYSVTLPGKKNNQLAVDTLKSAAEAKKKALNETLSMVGSVTLARK